jgi:hypothetical protein
MTTMKINNMSLPKRFVSFLVAVFCLWLLGCGQKPLEQTFSTPADAVVALVDAVRTNDFSKIDAILGPNARSAIASGDDVADHYGRDLFMAAYFQQASLSGDETSKTLLVGTEEWPFPIPVVKAKSGWHFDTAAGIDELRFRRIGRNELSTIDFCLGYQAAQQEYAQKPHDGNPAGTYAQKFASTPGKQDGLYWQVKEGEEPSPLGDMAAEAAAEGYTRSDSKPTPFRGYYFHILTTQGANATGGAFNYIENGLMRRGFALVAFPAEYGKSGVMTFVVNQDGVVYEKDLGSETSRVAGDVKEFNPDSSWEKVKLTEE